MELHGWSNAQAAWTFSLAIASLGLAAALGGVLLPRWGPRRLAVLGGVLYAAGHAAAAYGLASAQLWPLWLGFGVVGGAGLGLAYVVPVATVARWFPDRPGLATGLVVMGFGLGALVMSKLVAPAVLAACGGALPTTFLVLAAGYLVVLPLLAWPLADPPGAQAAPSEPVATVLPRLRRAAFVRLWLAFACAITAGIMLIGFQSPLLQDLLRGADPRLSAAALAAAGATLIGVSSAANGFGRLGWGALSDRLGRACTLRLILLVQVLGFAAMLLLPSAWPFAISTCVVLLCYGGAFGTAPALVRAQVGPAAMPIAYGVLLTAWSVAGLLGPQAVALIRDHVAPTAQLTWVAGAGLGCAALGLIAAYALSDAGDAP
jgi:OFA family oxalate/formate antiporter-like MFS transporter